VVTQSMQRVIQQWGNLMEVTGGALAPDRSWWYLREYSWKRGKWTATDAGIGFDLVAHSPNNEFIVDVATL
jgi:hypothetical protein